MLNLTRHGNNMAEKIEESRMEELEETEESVSKGWDSVERRRDTLSEE